MAHSSMPPANPPYPVGLTGGIGSGKSTVADLFAAHGVVLIDADALAHQITTPGGLAIDAIRAAFGEQALTPAGAMDRDRMRALVFTDNTAKARLEAILHPMIREESNRQYLAATSPYVLFVVPLLFESRDWKTRMRRTLLVDCPEEEQIRRVQQRSGLATEQIRAIMAKQMARAQRRELADDIIDNGGDGSNLAREVAGFHHHYLKLAQQACQSVS
jgi:dephospho-CoA kinase